LPVTDKKCLVEKVIKGGINKALRKAKNECSGEKQLKVAR